MTRKWGILVTSILAALLMPAGLSAQSYGLGSQVLSIGASAFRAENGHGVIGSDGYLYNADPNDPAGGRGYDAPLTLPDGAEITGLCIYFRNDGSSANFGVSVSLDAANLVPGGLAPGFHVIGGLDSTTNNGYSEGCGSVLPFYT